MRCHRLILMVSENIFFQMLKIFRNSTFGTFKILSNEINLTGHVNCRVFTTDFSLDSKNAVLKTWNFSMKLSSVLRSCLEGQVQSSYRTWKNQKYHRRRCKQRLQSSEIISRAPCHYYVLVSALCMVFDSWRDSHVVMHVPASALKEMQKVFACLFKMSNLRLLVEGLRILIVCQRVDAYWYCTRDYRQQQQQRKQISKLFQISTFNFKLKFPVVNFKFRWDSWLRARVPAPAGGHWQPLQRLS